MRMPSTPAHPFLSSSLLFSHVSSFHPSRSSFLPVLLSFRVPGLCVVENEPQQTGKGETQFRSHIYGVSIGGEEREHTSMIGVVDAAGRLQRSQCKAALRC